MVKFFSPEERKTEELMVRHVDEISSTLETFKDLMFAYISGDRDHHEIVHEVRDYEHSADETRREVERCIYRGSFLPVVREDYLMVAELMDKIADRAQLCANIVTEEEPYVPDTLKDDLREMVREVKVSFVPLKKLIELEDKEDRVQVQEYIDRVEAGEQRVDSSEWHLIEDLYKIEDLSLSKKVHLRYLINEVASISDCIEDVSDRMLILLTKEIF